MGCVDIDPADVIIMNTCEEQTVTMALSQTEFCCADISAGPFCETESIIVATVTQESGSTATCNAEITVLDTIPPTAICNNLNLVVDETFVASDLDGGSSDNCPGDLTLETSRTSFSCDDLTLGNPQCIFTFNQILVVTDECGNSSSCSSLITLRDVESPMAMCQDVTVELNSLGTALLTTQDLDNGSTDNCSSPLTFSASQLSFSCADLNLSLIHI